MSVTSDVKRRIIGVTTLFVIFVILGALLVFEQPQSFDVVAYEVQAQIVFEDAKSQFEYIRNVTLPADINLFVYTKQQAIDRWCKDSSDLNTASVLRQENIYRGLFLMSENDSLNGAAAEWIASWTAASVNNEIYVIYENFWPWDLPEAEAVLIHELTHVWQLGLPSPTSYDADMAYNALLEGDASYMGDYYRVLYNNDVKFEGVEYSSNNSLLAFIPMAQLNFVYPSILGTVTELNLFSYSKGKAFVSTIVDDGGWDMLNRCYAPGYIPSTAKHILHPDKYFAGEGAKTTLTPTPVDDSWIAIPSRYGYTADMYGEYFIYVMLSHWLDEAQAQEASAGWGGDSFTYYEKGNDFLFAWNITWDSIQDTNEFNQAFRDMLNHAQANPQDDNTWHTNGRYLTLTCNPNTKTTLILCSTIQNAVNPSFFI
ncbi:MAG: basic secretory family protein [Nitrososphaerota archaeon]|jgi:hypothetical protein|nr:basic secretory family protein [Nitrososphaerota archaeon]